MTIQKLPLQNLIDEQQLSVSYTYRIFEAGLGDGYTQQAPNGINNESRKVSITYKNLRASEFNKVLTFLRGLKGVTPFSMKIPGEKTSSVFRLIPDTLSTSITAIAQYDESYIVRSITFTAQSAYDIT